MRVTHTNEDENFAKHFFFLRERHRERGGRRRRRRKKKAMPRAQMQRQETEREQLFAKGVLHPPFGDLCIHTPAPDKRNRAALEPSELGAEEAREERSMIDGVLVGL